MSHGQLLKKRNTVDTTGGCYKMLQNAIGGRKIFSAIGGSKIDIVTQVMSFSHIG